MHNRLYKLPRVFWTKSSQFTEISRIAAKVEIKLMLIPGETVRGKGKGEGQRFTLILDMRQDLGEGGCLISTSVKYFELFPPEKGGKILQWMGFSIWGGRKRGGRGDHWLAYRNISEGKGREGKGREGKGGEGGTTG